MRCSLGRLKEKDKMACTQHSLSALPNSAKKFSTKPTYKQTFKYKPTINYETDSKCCEQTHNYK